MVYSPERIQAPPKTLDELTDPRFKGRVGWAPGNASLHAHVAALRSHWGEEKTKAWLTAMKANQPVVYPKNSPQVRAVSSGEIDMAGSTTITSTSSRLRTRPQSRQRQLLAR